jgi:hypothetical protein
MANCIAFCISDFDVLMRNIRWISRWLNVDHLMAVISIVEKTDIQRLLMFLLFVTLFI